MEEQNLSGATHSSKRPWNTPVERVCWWGRCQKPAAVHGNMTMRGVQRDRLFGKHWEINTLTMGYVQLCVTHWDRIRRGLLAKCDRSKAA